MLNAINHPCLSNLPLIFLRTMQGVSQLVDGFLGIQNRPELRNLKRGGDMSTPSGSSIPPSTPLSHSPPASSARRGKHSNLSRRSSNLPHFPEPPKSIMGSEPTQGGDGTSGTGASQRSRKSQDKLGGRVPSSQNMGHSETSAFLEQRRGDYNFESIPRTRPYVNSAWVSDILIHSQAIKL